MCSTLRDSLESCLQKMQRTDICPYVIGRDYLVVGILLFRAGYRINEECVC